MSAMTPQLGRFGAWLNPVHGDAARTEFAVEAEALGYGAAWLGFGSASVADLELVERILDATSTITIATAIVNIWTNDATTLIHSYHRIAARHPERFLLGIGVGHPESIQAYHRPYQRMVKYLDQLDGGSVPRERRILAALGPRTLKLASERTAGAHPYLVLPEHTRHARETVGAGPLLAPEHTVLVGAEPEQARAIGRAFLRAPYLQLSNYVRNLLRHGYTDDDVAGGGSDRLVDALVLHGAPETIAGGLAAHFAAGADHVGIQVLTAPGGDPMPGYRALARALL